MRENRKRIKPIETDSKFKVQEEKTKRRNKGRSNHTKHCANATPTPVSCCYSNRTSLAHVQHPAATDPEYLQEEGRITATYFQVGKLRHKAIPYLDKSHRSRAAAESVTCPQPVCRHLLRAALKVLSDFITYFTKVLPCD